MIISFVALLIYISFKHVANETINITKGNEMQNSENIHYENLFNSIEFDFYNLSLIYNDSYNSLENGE